MDIDTMRYYYQNGLWSRERLEKLAAAGRISQDDMAAILQTEAGKEEAGGDAI